MKPSLWESVCFKKKVDDLHLNQDHQVVPEIIRLEDQKNFSKPNQNERVGWGGQ